MTERDLEKAALCGEPSYVWREGQARRLEMIVRAAGERIKGCILENGCGVGMYVEKLSEFGGTVIGLEFDRERAVEAHGHSPHIINAAGEHIPFPSSIDNITASGAARSGTQSKGAGFDLILSHEVLEHVQDDRAAVCEMVRVLRPGGRIALFCPNRGYPFETHGVFWRGRYKYGNIPLVNYLPRLWRNKLAPHVRVYSRRDLEKLFEGLPVRFVVCTVIFGAYDNLIARFGAFGRFLRALLQWLEKTPLRGLGLSHFWVVEKTAV
jgi:SAM-dependent methyltransferase